jgi:hypothetical protein
MIIITAAGPRDIGDDGYSWATPADYRRARVFLGILRRNGEKFSRADFDKLNRLALTGNLKAAYAEMDRQLEEYEKRMKMEAKAL